MSYNINQSQNGTHLRESASFEPLSVKIWWAVWPVDELLKKGTKLGGNPSMWGFWANRWNVTNFFILKSALTSISTSVSDMAPTHPDIWEELVIGALRVAPIIPTASGCVGLAPTITSVELRLGMLTGTRVVVYMPIQHPCQYSSDSIWDHGSVLWIIL